MWHNHTRRIIEFVEPAKRTDLADAEKAGPKRDAGCTATKNTASDGAEKKPKTPAPSQQLTKVHRDPAQEISIPKSRKILSLISHRREKPAAPFCCNPLAEKRTREDSNLKPSDP